MLVLAAEHDVLCTPPLLLDTAERYRAAFRDCVNAGILPGVGQLSEKDECDGVACALVKGVAHHLQNHVEWEKGAEEVEKWVEKL